MDRHRGRQPGRGPYNAAQSLAVLSGKLLRLDPTPSRTNGYKVPATNPFVRRPGARPEIWASGLRNPWRFSFDRATGDLWIGDVGQYVIEEIDAISLRRSAGANFGWNRLEGRRRFTGSPPPRAVPPTHQYDHSDGRCAVRGRRRMTPVDTHRAAATVEHHPEERPSAPSVRLRLRGLPGGGGAA